MALIILLVILHVFIRTCRPNVSMHSADSRLSVSNVTNGKIIMQVFVISQSTLYVQILYEHL